MNRWSLSVIAALGLVGLCSTSAHAAPGDVFLCEFTDGVEEGGFIPPKIGFVLGKEGEPAFVTDQYILHYNKEPVAAKVKKDNDSRVSLEWKLKAKNIGVIVIYSLLLTKKDMVAQVRVTGQGDYRTIYGKGKCARVKK